MLKKVVKEINSKIARKGKAKTKKSNEKERRINK
jgi:hypothetical protein